MLEGRGRSMKSRTGCETCRQRKLKCDERKPKCNRCRKAGRNCIQGSIFRHQDKLVKTDNRSGINPHYSPTLNGIDRGSDRQEKIFTFVYVNDPNLDEAADPESPQSRPPLSPPIIPVVTGHSPNHAVPLSPSHLHLPASSPSNHEPVTSPETAVSDVVSEPTDHFPADFDTPQQPVNLHIANHSGTIVLGSPFEGGHDIQVERTRVDTADSVLSIQLIWYFKEGPGKWMDLYDVTAYFTFYVPRLAATRPLLRSACCALASKHIRRLLESRQPAWNTPLPHLQSVFWKTSLTTRNWNYESAAYYDDAIRRLNDEITKVSDVGNTLVERSHRSEEALAAIAILCVYELLDAPGPEWSAHLSALPLLKTAPAQILDTISPQPPPRGLSTRSIFWNFVRQDYLYAFIHETHTRLDPNDPYLWRESGLIVEVNGFPQLRCATDTSTNIWFQTDEDLVSHTLFWILGRIVNFIADMGDFNIDGSTPQHDRPSENELRSQWKDLDMALHRWSMGLPSSLSSFVRTPPIGSGVDAAFPTCPHSFDRITYTIPTCGSTMQNYHMARILLLMNKPPERRVPRVNFTERLDSYRRIQEEAAHHSREICGISLSSPTESVRIQSVQPLFVAGQCLSGLEERDMVVNLLRGIEEDLGWATGYRIQKLIAQWEASPRTKP
ncbi:hypothetical protein BU24DRAFT_445705 [Aaosphaeria arxii CBS 175.79]|uniref:Zn(2)-C6 fungal-type domain-containing protein n=1 Tax=Aaosphaeria arxii CBS 175.79 TaxID=1450172 RepID=A0A6A5Y5K9_9PLEO|nr:uncharacterized protein BU24DRAFT_445705 [Aaosphaeria arxii CBS 175.79]KAF2020493.1 hypothetical protein BU24DRAFT_445705 [Aaosphaeria arxii CBS 175.79]